MSALTLVCIGSASALVLAATTHLTQALGPAFVARGLKGRDMLKPGFREPEGPQKLPGQVDIPESLGLVGAGAYIMILTVLAPIWLMVNYDTDTGAFPYDIFAANMASLQSLLVATLLGFLDDLFDIKWKYKIPIPLLASIPLVATYIAGAGVTTIHLPSWLPLWLTHGTTLVDLGPLYYLYMMLLSTFCTNAINILAGVNGVEVGQTLVIALSIALNDFMFLRVDVMAPWNALFGSQKSLVIGNSRVSDVQISRHAFSLQLMLPLAAMCYGLLRSNWYPAKVFVGDTFCYFAGMVFAAAGILGHFGRTLLLFFIPQVFNFVYSAPQLFKLVPCPRHRLPRYNVRTDLLEPSECALEGVRPPVLVILKILHTLKLLRLTYDGARPVSCTNLTLLNLLLVWFGPCREPQLTRRMLLLQACCSGVAYVIRYGLVSER